MRKPALAVALSEPIRATGELATSAALAPFVPLLPAGDGHTVVLLPGFMASDRSTTPLRAFLVSRGYRAFPWGLGRNIGPTDEVMDTLPRLVDRLADRSGRRVSLIGWSLGGVYARWLARLDPGQVRQVITLGTPVRSGVSGASNASALYEWLSPHHREALPGLDEGAPLGVPCTALHTRTDGIVHWSTCIIEPGPRSQNVRVAGSHVGLGFNPASMWVIAQRLAQEPNRWEPLRAPRSLRSVVEVLD